MAIRILSDQNVTSNVIAIQAFRLGTDSLWKIRGNAASTELAFEYSTSSSLSDANIKVVFNSLGNVNIGSSLSSEKLEVGGTIRIRVPNTSSATLLLNNTDTQLSIDNTGGNMIFTTSGAAERMRITSSGNVGIGEDNPQENLHITATTPVFRLEGGSHSYQQYVSGTSFYIRDVTNSSNRITLDSSGNVGINASASLRFNGAGDNTHAVGYDSTIDGSFLRGQLGMRFLTGTGGGSERMRIDSSGNVGIGTVSPQANLHINEDTSNSYGILRLEGANRGGIIEMYNQTSYPVSSWTTDQSGNIFFATSGAFAATSLSTKFTILTGGNVGIGTTSPSAKLEVNGALFVGNHTGTVTPTSGIFIEEAAGVDTQIQMYTYGGSVFRILGSEIKADIGWGSSQNRSVNFNNTGAGSISVGIGTTTPGRKLTVTGDVSGDANNLLLANENDTDGDSASIGFSMLSNNTYVKAGIFFKRTTTQGRGELILAVNNEVNGNNVTLSDSRLTINNLGDAYFYREIFAAATTGTRMRVPRNLFVSYGGSSYDYTFDPVALFGSNQSGGTLGLRVSGWPTRLFDGIIIWRNDGGGSSKIGTGVVTLVQIATNDFSGVGVSVSLPSSNTNEIKISFSGFHSNDHGWECYIKTEY